MDSGSSYKISFDESFEEPSSVKIIGKNIVCRRPERILKILSDSTMDPNSSSDKSASMNDGSYFPQFNDLPPEIKEHIIRQRPKLIPAFSLVNRELHQLSGRLYLTKIGGRSLQYHEIAQYRKMSPLILGTHNHTYHSMERGLVHVNLYKRECNMSSPNISVIMDFDDSYIKFQRYHHDESPNDYYNYDKYEYDYLTQYHILSKRLSCVHLHPSYAKDYILHYLDRWYQTLTDESDDRMSFYLFLWMNAHVFQIPLYPRDILSLNRYNVDDMLRIVNDEIARLYMAIRDAIMKLN